MIGLSNLAANAQFDLKKETSKLLKKTTGVDGLSNEDIGNGLKEALNAGVQKGVTTLSATDGFLKNALYKILIPEDVRTITSKLKQVPGFGNVEDQLIEKMNRGAEKAATKAAPIFANAITSLTFQDALNILMGEKNAATQYLNKTTGNPLYQEFNPIIKASLEESGWETYERLVEFPLWKEFEDELRRCLLSDHPAVSNKAKWALEELGLESNPQRPQKDGGGQPASRPKSKRPS